MADNRISMPSGMGGLMRYFDEYKSNIQLKPAYVVVLVIIFIALVMLVFPAIFPVKV